uniref:Ribonucleases P/MRP protein subunit POP1 n=1 Tax=Cacopsylla melanoneura TaxID=428564 RepID=A0A8D9DY82_9HEMI
MDETPIPASSRKSVQYDIELGGKTQLPFAFNVEEYVAGHIEELKALTNAIENPTKTKLAFQRLPKHMRRRVMSHNVKRMPVRLREAHAKYLQKQNLKTPHRPSRKYRRRPSNLLAEYNRRARRVAWLETHIWHAKRFAMVEAWGYKLAQTANEKSYRASVRALDRHCLMQDISYLVCLELSGPESHLTEGLSTHFDSRACFTPGAKMYRAGCREGQGMFYARGRYPYEAIGNVKFLWRATKEEADDADSRTLWLWTHPSYYQTIVKQLKSTFSLEEEEPIISTERDLRQNNTDDKTSTPSETDSQSCPSKPSSHKNSSKSGIKTQHASPPTTKKTKKLGPLTPAPKVANADLERQKLAVRKIPHTKIPAHFNVRIGVRMRVLKDVLNRFELRGPLSGAVIARALNLFTTRSGEEDTPPNLPVSLLNTALHPEDEDRDTEEETSRFKLWRLLRSHSPSQFPPRIVLGAVVRDPRFNMPAQRTRNELDTPDSDEDLTSLSSLLPSPSLSISPVWDPDLRDWVSVNKPSTHAINTLFSTRLVPGVPKPEELRHALPLPLLLIQQEGVRRSTFGSNYKKIGFGSGWDLIFPAGWSMPLLLGLMFNGARVGGLREASQLSVQMRSEPTLACDTKAWREVENRRSEEAREKYFRKPPKKRPNFIRLGNASPFAFHWTILLRDWHNKHSQNNTRLEDNNDGTINVDEEDDDEAIMKEHRTGKARQKLKQQQEERQKQSQNQEKHPETGHQKQDDHQQAIQTNKPYVLRDKTVIEKLNTLIANINSKSSSAKMVKAPAKDFKGGKSGANSRSSKPNTGGNSKSNFKSNSGKYISKSNFRSNMGTDISASNFDELEAEILNDVQCRDDCLVQVNVQIIKRGTMDKYAHICLPSEDELLALGGRNHQGVTRGSKQGFKGNHRQLHTGKIGKQYRRHHGEEHLETSLDETSVVDNINHIQEPLHRDGNQLARKTLKEGQKKLLLRLKRRRMRAKKKGSEDFDSPKRVKRKGGHPTKELVEVYQEVMRKLWIPDVEEELKEEITDRERVESEGKEGNKENIINKKENMDREKVKDRDDEIVGAVKKQVNEANTLEERLKKTNISVDVKNYLEKVSRNIWDENSAGESRCREKLETVDTEKTTDSETRGEVMKERKRCLRDEAEMDVDETENTPKRKKTENSEEFTPQIPQGAGSIENELRESKRTEKIMSELQTTLNPLKEITKSTSTLEVKTKLKSYDSDVTGRILSRLRPIRSLRFVASHELFGFVTSSSFHSTAQYGQGCVSLNGLLECLRRGARNGGKVRVLVRRSSDVNYHWAEISVL